MVVRKARGGRLWGKKLKSSFAPLARENRSTSGGGCTGANDAFASCCRKTSRPRSQPTYPRRITTRVSKTFHYSYTRTHTRARTLADLVVLPFVSEAIATFFHVTLLLIYALRRKIDLTRRDFLPDNSPL